MEKEDEIFRATSHAIIGRFVYGQESSSVEKVDQYDLEPGSVLIFTGTAEDPERASDPMSGRQDSLEDMLQQVMDVREHIQIIAVLDQNTGGLLITDGTEDNSYGINAQVPPEGRVIAANFGRTAYCIIWGESRSETTHTLRQLQAQRARMN
ncbi:MAG: hypothetical protein NUV98_07450 [Candidatus Roizmanbacteria bacterium]|nr:hypothetical protein [Candidatus Roizmanbacteria bacterium]